VKERTKIKKKEMKNQETTKTYRAQRPKALVRRSYQGIGEISNEKYKRTGKDKKKKKTKVKNRPTYRLQRLKTSSRSIPETGSCT
jgi:hypothetical protein